MQKPTSDAIQLVSMLEDFKASLLCLGLPQSWQDAVAMDPNLPVIQTRNGWRGVEEQNDVSTESW